MPSEEYEIAGKEQWAHIFAPSQVELDAMRESLGVLKDSLLALKEESDPFCASAVSHMEDAKWFKALWKQFGYTTGVHLRRMHYAAIHAKPPAILRVKTVGKNKGIGTLYENEDEHWQELQKCSLYARYLWYVLDSEEDKDTYAINPEWIEDHRNGNAVGEASRAKGASGDVWATGSSKGIDCTVASAVEPTLSLPYLFTYVSCAQPYHLEVWCEKSTQDDILIPLVKEYDMILRHGMGELSATIAIEFMRRLQEIDKPVRIFYLSDFDPNGWDMPKSMSRKIQFYNQMCKDIGFKDIKIFHTLLTPEQVKQYELPSVEIKATNKRKEAWIERWKSVLPFVRKRNETTRQHELVPHEGTELDALEGMYPGELRKLLVAEIERYYDPTLQGRVKLFKEQKQEECREVQEAVYEIYASFIAELESKRENAIAAIDKIKVAIQEIADEYQVVQDALFEKIKASLEENAPELTEENVPLAREADESRDPLFDSSRNFLDQNAYYQAHLARPIQYLKPKGRKPKSA